MVVFSRAPQEEQIFPGQLTASVESERLSSGRAVLYALPAVSMAMLWTPLNVMQGIYIKHYGFPIALLALILLCSRVYDAVADLAVGTISDWRKAKSGTRKPMLAAGALLFAISGYFIYVPPQNVGPYYLTFWLFAFYTSYSTLTVPHLAWGAELAPHSRQKTAIFGLRTAALYTGLCIFYSVPLLPVFGSPEITPTTIKVSTYLAIGILLPALAACLRWVPPGTGDTAGAPHAPATISLESLRIIAANRPFRIWALAYLLCAVGLGVWYGMIFIFVDIYLRKGSLFAPLYLLAFAVGVASSFAWNKVAAKLGKKVSWSIGMGIVLIAAAATSLFTPNTTTALGLGTLLVISTIGIVCSELLPGSILGDITDYSLLKSGRNHAATYFSIHMFLIKVLSALGGAVGLGLSAWLGFDPQAAVQTSHGVFALEVVMSWVPGTLIAIAIVLILSIPMDERRHAIVRKRLSQCEQRRNARPCERFQVR